MPELITSKLYHTNAISITMHADRLLCLMHIVQFSRTFHPSLKKKVILHLAARGAEYGIKSFSFPSQYSKWLNNHRNDKMKSPRHVLFSLSSLKTNPLNPPSPHPSHRFHLRGDTAVT